MVTVHKKFYIIASVLIVAAFFTGKNLSGQNVISSNQETRQSGYQYISPLLSCDNLYDPPDPKLGLLKKSVEKLLDSQKNDVEVSVFFRHLNNGPVFGINEHIRYSPASLLKVPIMIALFKQADLDGPSYLEQKILVKNLPITAIPETPSLSAIKINTEFSVMELIERMIKNSDNQSAAILKEFLGHENLLKTYSDLGVDLPTGSSEDPISTKTYSSLFRILYNSSYLSRKYSELALTILSQTTYSSGLTANIPNTTLVSHKFGERSDSFTNQLHDCGIVYIPGNPYLLCIMTKGNNKEDLTKIIAKISHVVFQAIAKEN
jgi:beta-lactamase class A